MATDHFCLKWNNFHSSIVTAFESLQSSEDLVDVTLMCEGRNVKAHKIILSACSPYFRNLFKETPCQHPIIILKDVLHCDLVAILQFMYQGEVLITQDGLSSFLKTAELLQVSGLAGNSPGASTSTPAAVPEVPVASPPPVIPKPTPPVIPIRPSTPISPKTTLNKNRSDVSLLKLVELEKYTKQETIVETLPVCEPEPEPMQSCSYEPESIIIKTESDDHEFEDEEYNAVDNNAICHEIIDEPGPAVEEQSILERSLKAPGMSPHATKLCTLDLSIGPQISTLPSPNQSATSPHPDLMKIPCVTPLLLIKNNPELLTKDVNLKRKVKTVPESSPSAKKVLVKSILPKIELKRAKVDVKEPVPPYKGAGEPVSHGAQFGNCPHCNKVYSNQSALKYHVRLVHSDMLNMFCCHLCPESFEYRESYKVHMWEKHSVRN